MPQLAYVTPSNSVIVAVPVPVELVELPVPEKLLVVPVELVVVPVPEELVEVELKQLSPELLKVLAPVSLLQLVVPSLKSPADAPRPLLDPEIFALNSHSSNPHITHLEGDTHPSTQVFLVVLCTPLSTWLGSSPAPPGRRTSGGGCNQKVSPSSRRQSRTCSRSHLL